MSTKSEMLATPQPPSRRVRIAEVDGDLKLTLRQNEWGGGCFLLLWLSGWTVGCTMGVRQAVLAPSFFNVLVTIPFLASWFFVFGILVWECFGVERVRLSFEGLEHRVRALVTLSRRLVPRAELKNVCAAMSTCHGKRGEQPCVRFETLGHPIDFACGISAEEQGWLVERLNEYLDAPRPQGPPEKLRAGHRYGITTNRPGILQPAATPVGPPSDSRIECGHPLEGIAFTWRGRWSLATITMITFFNLFLNPILCVVISKHVEDFNRVPLFAVILFSIVGLGIFALWLVVLTAPSWRLRWTFGEQTATKRMSFSDADGAVFDLGWTKRFAIHPPVRIELSRREGKKQSQSFWWLLSHPDGEYTLSFLDQANKEVLAIKRLTEGDARWIADVLLRTFPSWSGPVRVMSTDWNPQETSRQMIL